MTEFLRPRFSIRPPKEKPTARAVTTVSRIAPIVAPMENAVGPGFCGSCGWAARGSADVMSA